MVVLFCEFLGFPAGMRNFEGLNPSYGHGLEVRGDFDCGKGLAGGNSNYLAYFWNAEAL